MPVHTYTHAYWHVHNDVHEASDKSELCYRVSTVNIMYIKQVKHKAEKKKKKLKGGK